MEERDDCIIVERFLEGVTCMPGANAWNSFSTTMLKKTSLNQSKMV